MPLSPMSFLYIKKIGKIKRKKRLRFPINLWDSPNPCKVAIDKLIRERNIVSIDTFPLTGVVVCEFASRGGSIIRSSLYVIINQMLIKRFFFWLNDMSKTYITDMDNCEYLEQISRFN